MTLRVQVLRQKESALSCQEGASRIRPQGQKRAGADDVFR